MKRFWFSYIAIWIAVLLISPPPPAAYANSPTVTVTKTSLGLRANLYSISYSVIDDNADTAFVYNDASTWFAIDGVGAHASDSLITLECFTSETTADSVRHMIIYQVSSKASPNITARGVSSDWITAYVDSTVLNNKTAGSNPGISTFAKVRLAGQATKMRILVAEIGTVTKDASQTVTMRLVIPRR